MKIEFKTIILPTTVIEDEICTINQMGELVSFGFFGKGGTFNCSPWAIMSSSPHFGCDPYMRIDAFLSNFSAEMDCEQWRLEIPEACINKLGHLDFHIYNCLMMAAYSQYRKFKKNGETAWREFSLRLIDEILSERN